MNVSLYVSSHSTRRYELTKLSTIYPMGTIFVLRYGTIWETLPQDIVVNFFDAEHPAAKDRIEVNCFPPQGRSRPQLVTSMILS